MLPAAWAVYRKELREALRDRRTLVLGLLLPVVVMPAVTLGLPYLAEREEARLRTAPARVAVVGRDALAPFLQDAGAQELIEVVPVADPVAALRRGTVHAVLEGTRRNATGPVRLRVLYDESSIASLLARQKIDQAIAVFSMGQVERQLVRRGIRPERLVPIQVEHRSVRPAAGAGRAELALVLPFFVTVWILLGGQYAALDLGAGERERGTLPGLLVTPPSRLALVTGKFATVFTLATASVALVVATVLASQRLAPAAAGPATLPGTTVSSLVAVGLAFAAFLSALQLLLSLVARSVREAQQLFTPVYLLAVGGVLTAQILPEGGRHLWVYVLPVVNAAFLLRGLLLGATGVLEMVVAVAVLLVLTGAALGLAAMVYHRERLSPG